MLIYSAREPMQLVNTEAIEQVIPHVYSKANALLTQNELDNMDRNVPVRIELVAQLRGGGHAVLWITSGGYHTSLGKMMKQYENWETTWN